MINDIGRSFEKLKESLFVKYRGTLIMKTSSNGFSWNDKQFNDIESAKKEVDDSIKSLSKSFSISMTIVKEDGSEEQVSADHTNKFFDGKSPYESYKKSNS